MERRLREVLKSLSRKNKTKQIKFEERKKKREKVTNFSFFSIIVSIICFESFLGIAMSSTVEAVKEEEEEEEIETEEEEKSSRSLLLFLFFSFFSSDSKLFFSFKKISFSSL